MLEWRHVCRIVDFSGFAMPLSDLFILQGTLAKCSLGKASVLGIANEAGRRSVLKLWRFAEPLAEVVAISFQNRQEFFSFLGESVLKSVL